MKRSFLVSASTIAMLFCLGEQTICAAVVGESALIGTIHYADSFTIPGPTGRDAFTVYTQGNFDSPLNEVEQVFTNPAQRWQAIGGFAYRDLTTSYAGRGDGSGNSGNLTGFWETGGGDMAHGYALSTNYVVQLDAVLSDDRLDISSYEAFTTGILSKNSLSVLFRLDGHASPSIGLFNGAIETDTGFSTGIAIGDTNWHNFAVHFNHDADEISFYVDEVMVGMLDLTTFADGIYQNYGNANVGFGGTFVTQVDNYQVGTFIPEPASLTLLALSSLALRRRSRR